MDMDFDMDDVPLAKLRDDGLSDNECYPKMLVDDPTFAILNEDDYFRRNNRKFDPQFGKPPSDALTKGKTPPFPKNAVMHLAKNTTQHLIEGYVDCNGDSCATQVTPVRQASAMPQPPMAAPVMNHATATVSIAPRLEENGAVVPTSRSRIVLPDAPVVTAGFS